MTVICRLYIVFVLGAVIYFGYGIFHSTADHREPAAIEKDTDGIDNTAFNDDEEKAIRNVSNHRNSRKKSSRVSLNLTPDFIIPDIEIEPATPAPGSPASRKSSEVQKPKPSELENEEDSVSSALSSIAEKMELEQSSKPDGISVELSELDQINDATNDQTCIDDSGIDCECEAHEPEITTSVTEAEIHRPPTLSDSFPVMLAQNDKPLNRREKKLSLQLQDCELSNLRVRPDVVRKISMNLEHMYNRKLDLKPPQEPYRKISHQHFTDPRLDPDFQMEMSTLMKQDQHQSNYEASPETSELHATILMCMKPGWRDRGKGKGLSKAFDDKILHGEQPDEERGYEETTSELHERVLQEFDGVQSEPGYASLEEVRKAYKPPNLVLQPVDDEVAQERRMSDDYAVIKKDTIPPVPPPLIIKSLPVSPMLRRHPDKYLKRTGSGFDIIPPASPDSPNAIRQGKFTLIPVHGDEPSSRGSTNSLPSSPLVTSSLPSSPSLNPKNELIMELKSKLSTSKQDSKSKIEHQILDDALHMISTLPDVASANVSKRSSITSEVSPFTFSTPDTTKPHLPEVIPDEASTTQPETYQPENAVPKVPNPPKKSPPLPDSTNHLGEIQKFKFKKASMVNEPPKKSPPLPVSTNHIDEIQKFKFKKASMVNEPPKKSPSEDSMDHVEEIKRFKFKKATILNELLSSDKPKEFNSKPEWATKREAVLKRVPAVDATSGGQQSLDSQPSIETAALGSRKNSSGFNNLVSQFQK